jgi:phospholipid transport system substrate-binding protein
MKFIYHSIRLLVMLLFLVSVIHADDGNTVATGIVEDFHAILLDVMQNADTLGFKGRYDKLAPAIQTKFDTALISKVILSRYWNEMSDQQQEQFIQLFNRLSISTYASRFDSYSGESFRTLGTEELKKGRLLIRTELVKNNEKPVKFEYLVHQKDGNWYIISVIADGVNDLSLKRAEYATIINDRGFDSLVSEIQKKIVELGGSDSDT